MIVLENIALRQGSFELSDLSLELAAGEYGVLMGRSGCGKTTLLGVKIGTANRVPASYFVSVSYMCWAFRRHGAMLASDGEITGWLY